MQAGELWIEAIEALKHKPHLYASVGLYRALGAPESLANDESMAQEEIEASDRLLASLSLAQWNLVIRHDMRGDLLELAAVVDAEALFEWIASLG